MRSVRAAGALLLALSGGAVAACTAATHDGALFCAGQRATLVVSAASPYTVAGTGGNDVIAVTGGLHRVLAGGGNDTVCADGLGSVLLGGDGNDRLIGGAGSDTLDGGGGNDVLQGRGGPDRLIGGPGNDTVSYADHATPVTASIDGRPDNGSVNERDLIDGSVENLTGGSATDILTGNAAANVLVGGAGNDRLAGGTGNDKLEGLAGNDTLKGQAGHDLLDGGSGVNGCDQDAADTSARNCKFDLAPPVITGFQLLTPRLNIAAGQTQLKLQAEATDDVSGVDYITPQICDSNGEQSSIAPQNLELASGTTRNGVWQASIDLSRFTAPGRYTVCFLNAVDKATNLATYSAQSMAGSMSLPPGRFTFVVVNDQTDTTAPVVEDVVVDARSVDVTNGSATISTQFALIEDRSGLDLFRFAIYQDSQAGVADSQRQTAQPELLTPSAVGTDGSGRYRAVVQLPQGSAAGSWHISINARDRMGNFTDYTVPVTVIDRTPITTVPQLASITRTPSSTPSSQTFTMHVTSTRAAATQVQLHATGPGYQYANGYAVLISGTPLDGIWTATVELPSNAAGTWTVSSVGIGDVLGRSTPVIRPSVAGGDWTIS